jgi:pimeloyl-ACP methyl ester carboxylesterase
MLHGGMGTVDMFAQLLPALAETRQVIAVELQAHGHTGDVDRPLSFEVMADDIAALIKQLQLNTADIFGYSLGGGVALQTAIRHPDVVRKLVVASAGFKRDGWYPEVLAGMSAMNAEIAKTWVGSPMHEAYASVAPRPEDWPTLVGKLGELLRKDYDWSAGVSGLKAPTLILVGDADGVRLPHAVEMFALLGGGLADVGFGPPPKSQLAVLPGTTHFTILTRTDLLLPIIPPFLDAPIPEAE